MKSIFLTLFLFPLVALSQDCKLTKTKDDFTHEIKLSTGFIPFNSGIDKILLSVDVTSTEIDFFFAFTNSGESICFDNASTAIVNFEGTKSKSTFRNSGSMNCKGLFHITFRNTSSTPALLQRLSTQKIGSIGFTGNNKKATTIFLKDEQRQVLMNMAACIIKEGKTLIKQP
ncbi:MAG: hypothetical protein M3O67_01630 [Bacteroidota bacterium]|nr:hypothetical protein [Bacteroidota bacterium]